MPVINNMIQIHAVQGDTKRPFICFCNDIFKDEGGGVEGL